MTEVFEEDLQALDPQAYTSFWRVREAEGLNQMYSRPVWWEVIWEGEFTPFDSEDSSVIVVDNPQLAEYIASLHNARLEEE